MESLTGSSLKGVCLDKVIIKQRGLFLCSKDVCLSKKSENCVLGLSSSKVVHISLFPLQHKIIQPISCVHPLQSSFDSQTHTQSEETDTTATSQSEPVRVKFQLYKECSFGQHFHIVGDDPMLGSWDPSNAVPLDWSEGHVWTVELDIPSGKTISYKFIMKEDVESLETILWQQGPDRILQTWETKNIITVSEDWDNAELQKVAEEEPVAELSQEFAANPETLVVENLIPPTVIEVEDDVNEEKTNEALAIVAENVIETKEDLNTDLNEDTTMEAKSIGKNGMAFNDQVLSSKDESMLVADEKPPVLVPGLNQVLTSDVHIDKVVTENSVHIDKVVTENSVHIDKVVTENSVESNSEEINVLLEEFQMNKVVAEGFVGSKSEELSSTDELATDLTHPKENPEMMLNVKQEIDTNEDKEKSDLVEEGDWSNGKLMKENVFESDMQWGKRTLQKFFASLGFCKVELEG